MTFFAQNGEYFVRNLKMDVSAPREEKVWLLEVENELTSLQRDWPMASTNRYVAIIASLRREEECAREAECAFQRSSVA